MADDPQDRKLEEWFKGSDTDEFAEWVTAAGIRTGKDVVDKVVDQMKLVRVEGHG